MDQLHQVALFLRIHPRGRLIEHQNLRPRRQRPGDFQPSLQPVRQRASRIVQPIDQIERPQQFDRLFLLLRFFDLMLFRSDQRPQKSMGHRPVEPDQHIIQHAQSAKEPDILKCPGDSHPIDPKRFFPGDGRAAEPHIPGGGAVNPGHDVKHRCFPGPVGPDQPDQFPLVQRKIKPRQRPQAAEVDAEIFDLQ